MLFLPCEYHVRIVVRATRVELARGVLLITGTPPAPKAGAFTDFRHARIHSQRPGDVPLKTSLGLCSFLLYFFDFCLRRQHLSDPAEECCDPVGLPVGKLAHAHLDGDIELNLPFGGSKEARHRLR